MDQKERMLANLPYKAWLDGLPADRTRAQGICFELNNTNPKLHDERRAIVRSLFGAIGEPFLIESPFYCDLGYNIEIGDNFYSNYNCVILDVGKVRIGNNVMFAPNVSIYTAGHPIHPDSRNSGYEYGIDITIGNNVWIGGNSVINPGLTLGNNVVVGSGSVVTKSFPDNVVIAGNPARIIHRITDADKDYYFKNRRFDVTDY